MRAADLAIPSLCFHLLAACGSEVPGEKGAADAGGASDPGSGGDQDCESPLGGPFDPADLAACCPEHGSAHCIPGDGVDGDLAAHFASCDGEVGLCVPDVFLVAAGAPALVACTSLGDEEGVCMSRCLPEVADNAALLPQDVCDEHEKCVPCVSPLDGMPTGVCELGSCEADAPPGDGDGGSDTPPPATCCGGDGTCVPAELTGEQADALAQDSCPDSQLCVPNDLLDGAYEAAPCQLPLLGEGACMPECLGMAAMLPPGECADGTRCVPCAIPFEGETGACEFLP